MTNYSHGVKSRKEPPMKPLHRLPNGTWIDLASVGRISPYVTLCEECTVVIEQYDGRCQYNVPFASLEDAVKFADDLADIVNAARSMEGMAAPKVVP